MGQDEIGTYDMERIEAAAMAYYLAMGPAPDDPWRDYPVEKKQQLRMRMAMALGDHERFETSNGVVRAYQCGLCGELKPLSTPWCAVHRACQTCCSAKHQ